MEPGGLGEGSGPTGGPHRQSPLLGKAPGLTRILEKSRTGPQGWLAPPTGRLRGAGVDARVGVYLEEQRLALAEAHHHGHVAHTQVHGKHDLLPAELDIRRRDGGCGEGQEHEEGVHGGFLVSPLQLSPAPVCQRLPLLTGAVRVR